MPVHDHSAVEVEGLKAEMAAIQTQLDQAQREREEARAAVDHLVAERDALQARSDVLARAQQSLETEADSLTSMGPFWSALQTGIAPTCEVFVASCGCIDSRASECSPHISRLAHPGEREELLSRLAETEAELVNAHSRLTRQEVCFVLRSGLPCCVRASNNTG